MTKLQEGEWDEILVGTSRGYKVKIEGYVFNVLELASGYISFSAPTGDTKEDEAMFYNLVYYNQGLYNGKIEEKERIKNRISNYILEYKAMKEDEEILTTI